MHMEKIEKKAKQARYKWWTDKKMIGTIVLILSVVMLIFSFVKVPFLSSINGYTIGMLLGFYSPFFYFFVIYKSLILIFGDRVKLPTWVKLNNITYWVVAISIVFIGASMGFYQSKNGFTSFGTKTWGSFNNWFDQFTDYKHESAWTPNNTNGGLVGVFLYSFVAMALSGIGALVVSIAVLVIVVSFLVTGSSIGLYRDLMKKRKVDLRDKEIKDNVKTDKKEFDVIEINEDKKNKKNNNPLPFDDPF